MPVSTTLANPPSPVSSDSCFTSRNRRITMRTIQRLVFVPSFVIGFGWLISLTSQSYGTPIDYGAPIECYHPFGIPFGEDCRSLGGGLHLIVKTESPSTDPSVALLAFRLNAFPTSGYTVSRQSLNHLLDLLYVLPWRHRSIHRIT